MNEPSSLNAVFSLQNGIELIITFLVLLQVLYLVIKVKMTKLATTHVVFLTVLLLHFILLNSHRYFDVEQIDGYTFYVIYGPLVFLHAGLLQSKISEYMTMWISSALLVVGFLLFGIMGFDQLLLFLFIAIIGISLIMTRRENSSPLRSWLTTFYIYFLILVGIYPLAHLLGSMESFLLFKIPYSILFIAFLVHNFSYFINNPKFYLQHKISNGTSTFLMDDILIDKIAFSIESDKIYLKKSLTINEFALALDEPSYKLSKALKFKYQKSFPELINFYRVNEAKEILKNSNGDFVKIESLGFEVGFNAPSAFYAAFKKETGMTPKAFQRKLKISLNSQLES